MLTKTQFKIKAKIWREEKNSNRSRGFLWTTWYIKYTEVWKDQLAARLPNSEGYEDYCIRWSYDILDRKKKEEMYNTIATTACCTKCVDSVYSVPPIAERNNMMYLNDKVTLDLQQKDYFLKRVDEIKSQKLRDIRISYRMEFPRPTTAADMVARIKMDEYIIRDDVTDWMSLMDQIIWKTPEAKADIDGFNAAEIKLNAAAQAAKDVIMSSSGSSMPAALVEFSSTEF